MDTQNSDMLLLIKEEVMLFLFLLKIKLSLKDLTQMNIIFESLILQVKNQEGLNYLFSTSPRRV